MLYFGRICFGRITFVIASLAFFLERNTKLHEPIEKVMSDEFLDTFVAATNAHGENDEEFTSLYRNGISEDESGCELLKSYLAMDSIYYFYDINVGSGYVQLIR